MNVLLDSNIIIYLVTDKNAELIKFLENHELYCSVMSYVEVLGFHKLDEKDRNDFERFFTEITLLPADFGIIKRATKIRQSRSVSVSDAIISATAIENNLTLITRNVRDFRKITGLEIIDPIEGR